MPNPISQGMRNAIVEHKKNGATNANIAHWLMINERTVRRILNLQKNQGSVVPKPQNGGRKPAFGQDVMDKIIDKIKEQPDITLEELVEEFDLKISISALCRKLKKANLNFKKRRFSRKSNNEKMFKYFAKNG
jgi:transposase